MIDIHLRDVLEFTHHRSSMYFGLKILYILVTQQDKRVEVSTRIKYLLFNSTYSPIIFLWFV